MGVDLAAEPANTAIAVVEWGSRAARVVAVELPGDDEAVLRHAQDADKIGVDCPLGWPERFVEFVGAHRDGRVRLPHALSSADWRRSLAYRHTDEYVRRTLNIMPLSVAADRIGITAMRAARLQVLLAQDGHVIDRAGAGILVEVYPAAGLWHWELPHRRYKGGSARGVLGEVVDKLQQIAPWLRLGDFEQICRRHDHALDAVVSALLARAAALGLTTPPPPELHAVAQREGWIALPTCPIEQLAP